MTGRSLPLSLPSEDKPSEVQRASLVGRSLRLVAGLGAVALLAAACSSTPSTPSTPSALKTSKSAAKVKTAAATVVVKTGTATVSGKSETVLTDSAGLTLYYFTPDTSTAAKCTASFKLPNGQPCTTVWPPLLLSAGSPGASTSLTGTLSTASDGNGRQVEYNGHPLYLFSGDTAPGQAKGNGLLGKWWVATPSLAASSAYGSSTGAYGSSSGAYGSSTSSGSSGSYGSSSSTKSSSSGGSGSSSSGGWAG